MKINKLMNECRLFLGIQTITPSIKEVFVASLTALIATFCIFCLSKTLLSQLNVATEAYILISIAATSVLVFVVPHGVLSQPWQVIGGHLISAVIGVLCFKYFGDHIRIAAALAVSLSIMAMILFRCVHPPGGATALAAVIGGDAIHQLGFFYVLVPTLLNSLLIVFAATLFNYPFQWRRYPSHLFYKNNLTTEISPGDRKNEITTEDFLKSIHEHASFIDVTDEGWIEIFENAKRHAELDDVHPAHIEAGCSYSNGKIGKAWEVRCVESIVGKNIVKYNIEAGVNIGFSGQCSVKKFIQWSKFKAEKNDTGIWGRVA